MSAHKPHLGWQVSVVKEGSRSRNAGHAKEVTALPGYGRMNALLPRNVWPLNGVYSAGVLTIGKKHVLGSGRKNTRLNTRGKSISIVDDPALLVSGVSDVEYISIPPLHARNSALPSVP